MIKPVDIIHKCRYFCGIMIPEDRLRGQMDMHVYNFDVYSQSSSVKLPIIY